MCCIPNASTKTLRRTDLRADTPYNTYTRRGLPPTPVALPGAAALEAALAILAKLCEVTVVVVTTSVANQKDICKKLVSIFDQHIDSDKQVAIPDCGLENRDFVALQQQRGLR